jgi:uncharacterized protein (PEP-CTERM system associated)
MATMFVFTALADSARSGEWLISPSIQLAETFTDNVTLAPEDQESDFVTTISPGVSVRGNGARLQTGLDYRLDRLIFAGDTDRNRVDHDLRATASAELVEEMAFVDARASVNRQFASNTGAFSVSNVNTTGNRRTVQIYSLSPSLYHHFGNWADSESRYTLDRVEIGGEDVANTFTNRGSFTLDSGTRFGRLGWTVTLDARRTQRSTDDPLVDDTTTERQLADAEFQYVFNEYLTMLASGGYEKIDDQTLRERPDGAIWSVGVELHPGPRSSLRVTYGDRFETKILTVDATYEPNPRTTLSAQFFESIETSQRGLAQDLSFIVVDELGRLIDTRTGLPFVAGDPAFSLTTAAFRRERFSAFVRSVLGRNSLFVEGFNETREREATGVEQTVFGGTLNFTRRLSRRATFDLAARFYQTDFGTIEDREDELYTLVTSLSYEASRSVHASAGYFLTKRDSTVGRNELTENVLSVTVLKVF